MRRTAIAVVAGGAALVVAVAVVAQLDGPDPAPSPASPAPADGDPVGASPRPSPTPSAGARAGGGPMLVWTSGGLPPGLGDRLGRLRGVTAHTVVAGDRVDLVAAERADGRPATDLDPGWMVPLDALAVDTGTYPGVMGGDAAALADLGAGEAALGATSARLRGVEVGGELTLASGARLSVAAVVADEAVGAAEVVINAPTGARLGVTTPRFVLVAHDRPHAAMESAVRARVPEGTPVRVRGPRETPYLRHGDAVLPQALVKDRFGEFAYRRRGAGAIAQEAAWRREHLVSRDVPLLGTVRCHRDIVDDLAGALGDLAERGLGDLIDPAGYRGCHHARLIAAGGSLSRHSWGIAVDINVPGNPVGARGDLDPRVVEAFQAHGFTWGGEWLVPDPHHFEHVRPYRP